MSAGRGSRPWSVSSRVVAIAALFLPLAHARPGGAGEAPLTDWIRRVALPFETCRPRDDHRDLAALRPIVGDARVVALGDGTGGTREFFQLKHRMVEYLASEMGFTTFAIEANLPEASKLNDYVLSGRGDPQALLAGMNFWMWNTEEMLQLVEWMRRFNASGRGPLRFAGFDMQKPDAAAGIVGSFMRRADPPWADSIDALAAAIRSVRQARVEFVSATGTFPAKDAVGRRVRFSGLIRTHDVSGYAGLWWRADAGGAWRALDNMKDQQVAGTRDWKRYKIELDIPANTDHISFGMLLSGTGRAWFDSLAIEIDGRPWADPGLVDLAMESAAVPVGFSHRPGPGYRIAMDDSGAAVGRWSLCLSTLKDFTPADAAPQWDAIRQSAERVVRRLESEERRYGRARRDEEVAWAARNAHLLLQWSLTGPDRRSDIRDSSMAANVEWILSNSPEGAKVVLWARNRGVARARGTMGEWLATRFGRDMVVIGFATDAGQFTTMRAGGLQAHDLQPGPEGSIEASARASRIPRFLLDLRRAEPGSGVAAMLGEGLTMRSIAALPPYQQFSPSALSREYDVLAWVQRTHATHPLRH